MLGASNITIRNIAISGHAILKLNSLSQSTVQNVLIHNYRGTYTGLQSDSYPADGYTPPGAWCNMGYGGATSSLWVFGNCEDIDIIDCNVQFSSHHGVMLHSGDFSKVAKNINITGVRALYCGCGQLRGGQFGELPHHKEICLNLTDMVIPIVVCF